MTIVSPLSFFFWTLFLARTSHRDDFKIDISEEAVESILARILAVLPKLKQQVFCKDYVRSRKMLDNYEENRSSQEIMKVWKSRMTSNFLPFHEFTGRDRLLFSKSSESPGRRAVRSQSQSDRCCHRDYRNSLSIPRSRAGPSAVHDRRLELRLNHASDSPAD